MNESTATSSGNGAARPNGKGKPIERRKFDDSTKKAAVARVRKGESVQTVADSIPVVQSVLRGWLKVAGVPSPKQKAKGGKPKPAPKRIGKDPEDLQRDWAKKYSIGTTPAKKKYARQTVSSSLLPAIAIRDAITYLKHAKTDMYALLQTGHIKEFEEYQLNVLAALRLLQNAPT